MSPDATPHGTAGRAADPVLDTPNAGPAAIRGGAMRVVGYGLGVVLSVGSAALLFRHLGVEDGGRYVTVLSLIALFGGVTDAGLATIGVREYAVRAGSDRWALMRSILGLRVVLTAAAVAVATAFAAGFGYPPVMVAGTALAGTGLLFQNLQMTLGVSLLASLRFGWMTVLDLVRQTVAVGLIVVLVTVDAELLAFIALSIPAGLAVLVPTAALVRGDMPLLPSIDLGQWKALVKEVLPYAAAIAVTALYFRVAIILVSLIESARETGYFAAAFRIVEVLIVVPQLAVGAVFPILARASRDNGVRLSYGVQRVLDTSIMFGGLVLVTLLVGAPLAIEIVAGPAFAPAADVLRIQSVGLFASFVAAIWGYALLGLRKHREVLLLNLLTLGSNLVLTTALTYAAGVRGAAVATVIGEIVLAVAGAAVLARMLPGPAIRYRGLWRVAAAAAPAVALLALPGVPLAVVTVAAAAVYLVLLWILGGVPDELVEELRAFVRRRRR